MDDEDEDDLDLMILPNTEKPRSSDEDKPDNLNEENNSDDEKSDNDAELDHHNETLASKLLNRETCV